MKADQAEVGSEEILEGRAGVSDEWHQLKEPDLT
jgi:hypothetical protein